MLTQLQISANTTRATSVRAQAIAAGYSSFVAEKIYHAILTKPFAAAPTSDARANLQSIIDAKYSVPVLAAIAVRAEKLLQFFAPYMTDPLLVSYIGGLKTAPIYTQPGTGATADARSNTEIPGLEHHIAIAEKIKTIAHDDPAKIPAATKAWNDFVISQTGKGGFFSGITSFISSLGTGAVPLLALAGAGAAGLLSGTVAASTAATSATVANITGTVALETGVTSAMETAAMISAASAPGIASAATAIAEVTAAPWAVLSTGSIAAPMSLTADLVQNISNMPSVPNVPSVPSVPNVPSVPSVSSVPSVPNVPSVPGISTVIESATGTAAKVGSAVVSSQINKVIAGGEKPAIVDRPSVPVVQGGLNMGVILASLAAVVALVSFA